MLKSKLPARTAAAGMLWVSIALVFAKALSFFSQIVLGKLLSVETYALFGIAMASQSLIAGFYNPSVSKALIQNQQQFKELFPSYSAFAFQFGLLGGMLLIVIGLGLQWFYGVPNLLSVLCVTSLAIPLLASNTTLSASLSASLRFRLLNILQIKESFVYYIALISAAILGAEVFTVAIATVIGALCAHMLLSYYANIKPCYFKFKFQSFFGLFKRLRWVLLTPFLTALAMRSEYFIIGKIFSLKQIGYYNFAFMLITSITIPFSAGITQVLLPVFSRLKGHLDLLRAEVIRFSLSIVIMGEIVCIFILGLGPILVHLVWEGKWDGAQFLICALAIAMPFRFLATMSATGFEALGHWRLNNFLLSIEAVTLITFVALGASLAGMDGAIIGVITQRVLSGLMGFIFLSRKIDKVDVEMALALLKLYIPFVASSALLFALSATRHGANSSITSLWLASAETLSALLLFFVLSFSLNSGFYRSLMRFTKKSFF